MRKLALFRSFGIASYRYYYVMLMSQTMAMSLQSVSRNLLMYRLTGDVTKLGWLFLASAVPEIIFSLYGGVIADRLPKRLVMILGQMGSLLTALVVALALTLGILSVENQNSWLILVAITVIRGVIQGLVAPSRAAMVTDLVGRDLVMNAISLRNMGRNALRLVIPGIGGWMIDLYGFQFVYYGQTLLYAIAILATWQLPVFNTARQFRHSAFAQLKNGLRYVARQKNIMAVLVFALCLSMLSMPYQQLMPVFVEDILDVGATGMGILYSVAAGGAIVYSLILALLPNKKRGLLFLLTGVLMGASVAIFAFSDMWYLSLAMMVFIGAGNAGRMTFASTLLQTYTEDRYRGRVLSIYSMEHGFMSLSGFIAALVAGSIGVPWTVGGMALLLLACSLGLILARGRLVKMD